MWAAAASTENVKALLALGADVNARTTNGRTALLTATRYGNADAMRALLAAGADTAGAEMRRTLLAASFFSANPAVRDVLRQARVVATSSADLTGTLLNWTRDDLSTLTGLLALGVSAKEQSPLFTVRLPTVFLSARDGNLDAVRAFVGGGRQSVRHRDAWLDGTDAGGVRAPFEHRDAAVPDRAWRGCQRQGRSWPNGARLGADSRRDRGVGISSQGWRAIRRARCAATAARRCSAAGARGAAVRSRAAAASRSGVQHANRLCLVSQPERSRHRHHDGQCSRRQGQSDDGLAFGCGYRRGHAQVS